ncbi:unnamed protein product [Anisakis simplex]|uniref:Secreted protein n=1 Tax=Anisakis simplex TaxID=6269 RepID=A0A0M3KKN6_ANISI|nr:unnamed protein product [Anisakis simplex]
MIAAHRSGIQLFPYLFGNTFAAQSSSSGVFASDRSPHTPGILRIVQWSLRIVHRIWNMLMCV